MRTGLLVSMLLLACSAPAQTTRPATRPAENPQAALEQQFAQLLTGATLVGRFTIGDNLPPRNERYAISSAVKLFGSQWLITARLQYAQHDVTIPVPVTVKWAGDTPMIQLTNAGIPGLGSFTARVLFYGNDYAGTWSGGPGHGGHLFGHIEHDK